MSEPNVHVVTDLPAPKKPFYLRKTYVAAAATAAVAVVVVAYKKGLLEDKSVVIDSTADALTITKS